MTAQQKTAVPSLCLLYYLRLAEKVKENMGGDLKVGKIMIDYEGPEQCLQNHLQECQRCWM
jgi:hypothetical protein